MSTTARTALPTRNRLLSSCAVAAIALAAQSQPARAQGFQGTGVPVGGKATITTPTPTSTLVTVNAPRAIIDWTPTDAGTSAGTPIDFLPNGHLAAFEGGANANLTDYTVLNRIRPADTSRPIAFNGTVISRLQANSQTAGGRVWFYSPSGIIVGATGAFNVGSLLLTANNPMTTGTGAEEDFSGSGLSGVNIQLKAATDSRAAVDVKNGAQIQALSEGSYVALVAPRVKQGGNVQGNGGVAYIAAEDIVMRIINNGLFSFITATEGSYVDPNDPNDDGVTLQHTGTTSGPATSQEFADPHWITMMAVPKNDAVTMLLTGSMGYAAAASAEVINGRISLEALPGVSGGVNTDKTASIVATNATVTSDILGGASGNFSITGGSFQDLIADSQGDFSFLGGTYNGAVDIFAGGKASAVATAGNSLFAASNFNMSAIESVTFEALQGSSATVRGNLRLDASLRFSSTSAGTATLRADGGTIRVDGDATVLANGSGDGFENNEGRGGAATVEVEAENGYGSISIGGSLALFANAFGGEGSPGGNGFGGDAKVAVTGGSLEANALSIEAEGYGGDEDSFDGEQTSGGNGEGGTAQLAVSGLGTVAIVNDIKIDATGYGGYGFDGGKGEGGLAELTIAGGSVTSSFLVAAAEGIGGGAGNGQNGAGIFGDGAGGEVKVNISSPIVGGEPQTGSLTAAGGVSLFAGGFAGNSGSCGGQSCEDVVEFAALAVTRPVASGGGGSGEGGTIDVVIDTPGFASSSLYLDVRGEGGDGASAEGSGRDGGSGHGGIAHLTFSASDIIIGNLTVDASGRGGRGSDGGFNDDVLDGGRGGDAVGGEIYLTTESGSGLSVNTAYLAAEAIAGDGGNAGSGDGTGGSGGNGGNGGDATGGLAELSFLGGASSFGSLEVDVEAFGGSNFNFSEGGFGAAGGAGGSAVGRESSIRVADASLGASSLRVRANAFGGEGGQGLFNSDGTGGAGGRGGDGTGGGVLVESGPGGSIEIDDATLFSSGEGGRGGRGGSGDNGGAGGAGGNGAGGSVEFGSSGGTAMLFGGEGGLDIDARGDGGNGESGGFGNAPGGSGGDGGRGGDAVGGDGSIRVVAGSVTLAQATIDVTADAGNGGRGRSGAPILNPDTGAVQVPGTQALGGEGGDAEGGTGTLELIDGSLSVKDDGYGFFSGLQVNADADAGRGGFAGARGGGATGGDIQLATAGESILDLDFVSLSARADAGDGGNGGRGIASGAGGDATGGLTEIEILGGTAFAGNLNVDVQAFGGANFDSNEGGFGSDGGNGGDAIGGRALLKVENAGLEGSNLNVQASAFGGEGGQGGFNSLGRGGNGGDGGSAGPGEDSLGSRISVTTGVGGTIDFNSGTFAAVGEGGRGGDGNRGSAGYAGGSGGEGGSGTGGTIALGAAGGAMSFSGEGDLGLDVEGSGGDGGEGGDSSPKYEYVDGSFTWDDALAGAAERGGHLATITSESEDFAATGAITSPSAWAGASDEGDEGNFTWRAGPEAGQAVTFTNWSPGEPNSGTDENHLEVGADTSWNDLSNGTGRGYLVEFANEGSAGAGGRGGDGAGGSATVIATGGSLEIASSSGLVINADATGGDGGFSSLFSSNGGNGLGGSSELIAAGGSITVTGDVELDSSGEGGEGYGRTGDGSGGRAIIRAEGSNSAIVIGGLTELDAVGGDLSSCFFCGFDTALGGNGKGGTAAIEAKNQASIDFGGKVDVLAFGSGGIGYKGGDGAGGVASILSSASDINIDGELYLSAASYGGATFDSESGYGDGGGTFGDGVGEGLARLDIQTIGGVQGEISAASIQLDVVGRGGQASGCINCELVTLAAVAPTGAGVGGDGTGGTAIAIIDGLLNGIEEGEPTAGAARLSLDARGIGGSGESGYGVTNNDGNNGLGGSASVDFRGATNRLAFLRIDASGEGGDGGDVFSSGTGLVDGGLGGSGTGGFATLSASGGIATIDDLQVSAAGYGGEGGDGRDGSFSSSGGGAGGAGGVGIGGGVLVNVGGGGLTLPAVSFTASGFGGEGGRGGAAGSGTNGGTGGIGGTGAGGSVELRISVGTLQVRDLDAFDDGYGTSSSLVLGPTLDALGIGGRGGDGGGDESGYGGLGGAGGAAGDGIGGVALINAVGGILTAGPVELLGGGLGGLGGQGGRGGSSFAGGAGGAGGDGTGGTAELRTRGGTVTASGTNTVTTPNGTTTTVKGALLDAVGAGGGGGQGGNGNVGGVGGVGGNGAGGTALADVAGGSLTTGPAALLADGGGGAGGDGGLNGVEIASAAGMIGTSTGGIVELRVADGESGAAGSARLGATRMLARGGTNAGGRSGAAAITASAAAAGALTVDSLEIQAIPLTAQPLSGNNVNRTGFALTATGGAIRVLGDVDITTDQNAVLTGVGGGSLVADGSLELLTGGSIRAGQTGTVAGTPLLSANDMLLSAVGAIDAPSAGFASATDVIARANGAIALGFAQAGDDVDARSSTGGIAIGTARTTGLGNDVTVDNGPGDGSNIVLDAATTIRLDNGDAADRIILTARGGRIDSAGLLTATRLDASATTDIALTDVDVVESLVLSTPNGAVSGRNFASDGSIRINARDSITLAGADAGDFVDLASSAGAVSAGTVVAGSDIVIAADDDVTLDNGDAGGTIQLTSLDGAVNSAGLLRGNDIFVTAAADISLRDIVGAGRVELAAEDGSIDIDALGDVDIDLMTAGSSIDVRSDGRAAIGTATAEQDIAVRAQQVALANGTAGGAIRLTALTGNVESSGLLKATDLFVEAGEDIALGEIEIVNDLSLRALNGSISGSDVFQTGGSITLEAAETIDVDALDAGTFIVVRSDADALVGSASAGSDIEIEANGRVSLANGNAGGAIRLTAATGNVESSGLLKATDLFIESGQDIALNDIDIVNDLSLRAANGAISGNDTFQSGGSIILEAAETIDVDGLNAGRSILVRSDADALLGTMTAGTDISVEAQNITIANAEAGRDIDLDSPGAISVGFARAGDDFSATAGTSFAGTTVITTGEGADSEDDSGYGTLAALAVGAAGSNIAVDAAGAISLANGDANDALRLTSATGSVASSNLIAAGTSIVIQGDTTMTLAAVDAGQEIDIASGGAMSGGALKAGTGLFVNSAGGVAIQTIDAGANVDLQAQAGAVLVAADLKAGGSVDAAGRSVTLNAVGPLSVRTANATAGNVGLTSGGNLTVQGAQASGNVAASSGGTLALNGDVDGVQLSLSSRDIAVGANARVGTVARTTGIEITANGGAAVIGGNGTSPGYRLDNAEFGRLAGRDISIGTGTSTAGVRIEGLTVRGSAASSPNLTGRLSITGGGDVTMAGRLALENAGTANGVRVSAANAFYADTANSGIAVTNGSSLAGSVEVAARSITVASQSALTALAGAGTIESRSDRLGQNDGAQDAAGYIRGGNIRLAASDRVHVQNSGASGGVPDSRAGLTAGAGGITLVSTGTGALEVIINGRQENGSGGFTTGQALIGRLTLTNGSGGAANIAAGSTVNGCLISGAPCGVIVEPPPPPPPPLPEDSEDSIRDLLDEQEDGLTRPPVLAFGQLISVEGGALLPVIDEPVTGTGNDDIYLSADAFDPACQDERQDCVVDQPVTGSGNEELQRGNTDGTPTDNNGVDAPVTGTGNENLQDDDGEDEG